MTSYTKHRFHTLDGLRGIAAIFVMLYHYYWGLHLRLLKNEFLAVDFFFMLSGFIIFHAYDEKLTAGMSFYEYFVKRVARLYPLFLIGLTVGACFVWRSIWSQSSPENNRLLITAFLSNALFMPYLGDAAHLFGADAAWVFPSNFPLWSISFEMFASLFFVKLRHLCEKRLFGFCLFWLICNIFVSYYHGQEEGSRLLDVNSGAVVSNYVYGFPRLFFTFSTGMLLYRLRYINTPEFLKKITRTIWPPFIYLCMVAIMIFPSFVQGIYDLLIIALGFPILIWFGSLAATENKSINRIGEFLGWLSFPLYCLHMPILGALAAYNQAFHMWGTSLTPHLSVFASLLVTIAVASLVGKLHMQQRLEVMLRRTAYIQLNE